MGFPFFNLFQQDSKKDKSEGSREGACSSDSSSCLPSFSVCRMEAILLTPQILPQCEAIPEDAVSVSQASATPVGSNFSLLIAVPPFLNEQAASGSPVSCSSLTVSSIIFLPSSCLEIRKGDFYFILAKNLTQLLFCPKDKLSFIPCYCEGFFSFFFSFLFLQNARIGSEKISHG